MSPAIVLFLALAGGVAGCKSLNTTMTWWLDARAFARKMGLRMPSGAASALDAFVALILILVCVVVGFDAAVELLGWRS